ncbi:MAG: ketoacyl-ACP synthase III [Bacteroidetes bacterium]|nr:ketoacyl-ACP synthase III [Bacteroidota bacterium]
MTSNSFIIAGSGSFIPKGSISNQHFSPSHFYDRSKKRIQSQNELVISKFAKITGINERRWIESGHVTSDLGFFAAVDALEKSGKNKESIDLIICAQNFGDIQEGTNRGDLIPSVASRIKAKLGIVNPYCIAYDINFGCPAWILGLIQAKNWLDSENGKLALVIGVETLSRVSDPYDRDSMIFSDGAGAVILERLEGKSGVGILASLTRTDSFEHNLLLKMGPSYNPDHDQQNLYVKMDGPKLYEYALDNVPTAIYQTIKKAGLTLSDIKMLLIHQANTKMLEAITARLFKLDGQETYPDGFLPLIISWLGNNAVASVPTLYDLINRGKLEGYEFNPGDTIVFAAVGSGMSISAMVYKVP